MEFLILSHHEPVATQAIEGAGGRLMRRPVASGAQAMLLGMATVLDDWATVAEGTNSHPAFLDRLPTRTPVPNALVS